MDQMIYEIKIFSLFPFQFFQNYQSPDQGHPQSVWQQFQLQNVS